MTIKEAYERLVKKFNEISEKPILTNSLVLAVITIIVLGASLHLYIYDFDNFIREVLAEAHGMIFDIAIIGMLIYWLNQKGETRLRIKAYKDEIDDFRLWESEEAAFRTAGNIKRLNRHKIYDINLVNCYLAKANLNYVVLQKANLNYANLINSTMIEAHLEESRLNQTRFENGNLNQANFSCAYANGAIFKDANLIKSKFENAFLIKANFENAFLMEADLNGAYLTGADLTNANLYKADLRNTKGLSIEQLLRVKTLYLAKFDKEIMYILEREHPEFLGSSAQPNLKAS